MELFIEAVDRVKRVLEANHPVCIAWSGGKDSSVILAVALEAALQHKASGGSPKIVVTNSNTGIENPEIEQFVNVEMIKIADFARRKELDVDVQQATPALGATWAVRVLSGRGLPSFPGASSDCTVYGDLAMVNNRRVSSDRLALH